MEAPPRGSFGWLLSSPFTAIVSRMHLGSTVRHQQSSENDEMSRNDVKCHTPNCQVSSEEFQDRFSLSLYGSECSDSWVMEDMFEPSQYNPSYSTHSSFDSSLSQLDHEELLWRSWDEKTDVVSPEPLLYPVIYNPVKVRDRPFDTARQLPSQIQSDTLKSQKTHELQRSSATRSPRRTGRTRVNTQSPSAKPNYTVFPSDTQTIPRIRKTQRNYHEKSDSLPARSEPRVRPQRSRANTTPAPAVPALHPDIFPSDLNLSGTTTNSKTGSSSTYLDMPRFIHSAPVSPQYPPAPERDLMGLMVETSYFSSDEDDDDDKDNDNEDETPAFVIAMKSVLNLGRSSSSTDLEKLAVEKARTKAASGRNFSDTLNSWFTKKKKKRATL